MASTVAGLAGAGTGAVIRALAIGIPSFGVAARTGRVLGAVTGGGIGVGAAAGTTAAITKYREYQREKDNSYM